MIMKSEILQTARTAPRRRVVALISLFLFIVLLMANLNALVDLFLHPEIPYFDREHLIVGSFSGLTTAVLFVILLLYTHRLETAVHEVHMLKGFFLICSNCKKIRGSDEQWHPVDEYVTERTKATFSHSICPECKVALYGDLNLNDNKKERS